MKQVFEVIIAVTKGAPQVIVISTQTNPVWN